MKLNLIFDWSGTLAQDQELTAHFTSRTLEVFGKLPMDFALYQREWRQPASEFYSRFAPGIPMAKIESAFGEILSGEYPTQVRLFPGVKESLAFWARHHRLFICSSLPQLVLEKSIENLRMENLFTGIIGDAQDKRIVLPELLRKFNLHPDDTIYCGDSPHDLQAASVASVKSFGAGYGYFGSLLLEGLGADGIYLTFDAMADEITETAALLRKSIPLATVGALILDSANQMLLVRTRKWSGKYGIPGGKVQYGESLEEALKREIREETGLKIESLAFVCNQDCLEHAEFYRPRHFILVNYLARIQGEKPDVHLNHESEDYFWADAETALRTDLNGPTRFLINRVMERGLHAWEC